MTELPLVITARLRHADLWQLSKDFGSQSKLAKFLGNSPANLCAIINLQYIPSEKWWKKFGDDLFMLTGKTYDEFFPDEIRSKRFRDQKKTIEQHPNAARHISEEYAARNLLPPPSEALESSETQQQVRELMEEMSDRDRKILAMRNGMGDYRPHTLEELSSVFKVGRERIRQIELKASRMLAVRYRERFPDDANILDANTARHAHQ
jgi:RNA polymerase sigma factor (sigma-70 family)